MRTPGTYRAADGRMSPTRRRSLPGRPPRFLYWSGWPGLTTPPSPASSSAMTCRMSPASIQMSCSGTGSARCWAGDARIASPRPADAVRAVRSFRRDRRRRLRPGHLRELRVEPPRDLDMHAARERFRCYQQCGAVLPPSGGEPALTAQVASRRAWAAERRRADVSIQQYCPGCYLTLPISGNCEYCA